MAAALVVDVAAGARLIKNSVLGYDPIVAACFYGIGPGRPGQGPTRTCLLSPLIAVSCHSRHLDRRVRHERRARSAVLRRRCGRSATGRRRGRPVRRQARPGRAQLWPRRRGLPGRDRRHVYNRFARRLKL